MEALQIPDYRLLWSGRLISSFGAWLMVVAVPYHVYQLTGSAAATGLVLAVESLPTLILGPVAGVFADRWDRRRLMVATDILRAAAVALIVLADQSQQLWLVYLALLAESSATMFFRPAARALTPAVVGTGTALTSANSLNAATDGVMRLLGPPVGAVLLTAFGITTVVVIDIACYLLSALAISRITSRRAARRRADRLRRVLRELVDGLRYVRAEAPVRALLIVSSLFFTGNAMFTALLIPFTATTFPDHPSAVGYLLSALGVGYLAGAPLARRLVLTLRPRMLLLLTQLGVGASFVLLALAPNLPVALLAIGLAGIPGITLLITVET